MAAAFIYLLSKFKQTKPTFLTRCSHVFGLHPPPIPHVVLDDELLSQFKEIFVIGDVHGCYDELLELMASANVENPNVLKIFVGDLVNKGPKNAEVLKLMRETKSMLSVRGNHDECVLKIYNDSLNPENPFLEKNTWVKHLPKEDIDYLNNLPFTIRLPKLNALIVHAGLIPGATLETMAPSDLVTMRNITINDYFEGGIQASKTNKEGYPWAASWAGPYHVYFGHDAKRRLQKEPYATGLDTGCVYGHELTGLFIYGPRKGVFVDVKAKNVYEKPKG